MRCRLALLLIATVACSACSSSEPPASTADDASADQSEGADVGSSAVDAAADTIALPDAEGIKDVTLDPYDDATNFNDCTPLDFTNNDHTATADPRAITFNLAPAPQQYAPRCMKIRAGQTVTWNGAFQYHPLEPAGGDVPSPITIDPQPGGDTRAIAFPNAGMYGFECATHEAPLEYGAIQVVP